MDYVKFEITGPIYSMVKKISSPSLKIGDRFIYKDRESLMFKTNMQNGDGKFLCCDEGGILEWIDGEEEVTRLNRITFELQSFSKQYKAAFLSKI